MRTRWPWRYSYGLLQWTEVCFIGALAISGAVLKFNAAAMPWWMPIQANVIEPLQALCATAAVIGGGGLVVTRGLRSRIGHPNTWQQVQAILDQLQEELFGDEDPGFHHQVTLFRHRWFRWRVGRWRARFWYWGKWRWPWSGWLIPTARSGHGKKRSSAVFLAPDDLDSAEGIAGVTWAFGKKGQIPCSIENLPAMSRCSSAEDIQRYADRTFVSDDWVRWCIQNGRNCARSFAGTPIEINGEMWGVLVIDSRSEKLPTRRILEQSTKTAARLLKATLKGT